MELIRISNYAKKIDKSVTWVYKLAKAGKIEIVEIDGVKFVKEKQGKKQGKRQKIKSLKIKKCQCNLLIIKYLLVKRQKTRNFSK